MKKPRKNFINRSSGLTLVEMMVALSIFSISILGVMSLFGSSISNINYAKKKMTASYLAEGGIEFMRNMRDTFVLYDSSGPQAGWDAFLSHIGACFFTSGNPTKRCYFNDQKIFNGQSITSVATPACGGGPCPNMYLTSSGYGYDTTGSQTDFIREIGAKQISANEIQIFSTVTWIQKSGNYSTTFSENLYNWVE